MVHFLFLDGQGCQSLFGGSGLARIECPLGAADDAKNSVNEPADDEKSDRQGCETGDAEG
ncbi:hypothetical protein D3C87_2048570 [compost metagenome]